MGRITKAHLSMERKVEMEFLRIQPKRLKYKAVGKMMNSKERLYM